MHIDCIHIACIWIAYTLHACELHKNCMHTVFNANCVSGRIEQLCKVGHVVRAPAVVDFYAVKAHVQNVLHILRVVGWVCRVITGGRISSFHADAIIQVATNLCWVQFVAQSHISTINNYVTVGLRSQCTAILFS